MPLCNLDSLSTGSRGFNDLLLSRDNASLSFAVYNARKSSDPQIIADRVLKQLGHQRSNSTVDTDELVEGLEQYSNVNYLYNDVFLLDIPGFATSSQP